MLDISIYMRVYSGYTYLQLLDMCVPGIYIYIYVHTRDTYMYIPGIQYLGILYHNVMSNYVKMHCIKMQRCILIATYNIRMYRMHLNGIL